MKDGRGSGFYLFQASAHEYADDECIWSRSATYSWRQTYETVCRYGNYFLSLGVKPGDLVVVYSMNSPEYLFSWMGLLSIGAAPALINYNLTSDALLHCVKLSGAKMLLADPEEGCQIRIESSKLKIEKELKVKVLEMSEEFHEAISRCDSTWNDRHLRSLDKEPRLGLQYTRYFRPAIISKIHPTVPDTLSTVGLRVFPKHFSSPHRAPILRLHREAKLSASNPGRTGRITACPYITVLGDLRP